MVATTLSSPTLALPGSWLSGAPPLTLALTLTLTLTLTDRAAHGATATRRREWERTGNAALLAAALAEPTKEWLTPVLDSPAVAPVAVAADAAMDTATGGQP